MGIYGSNFDYGQSDFYKDDSSIVGSPVVYDNVPVDLFFDIQTPDIFTFKDVTVDFTTTPVYGAYVGKFKVKTYNWFFDPINKPTEYISTTDKTIYKIYVGQLGSKFDTKLSVVLEPLNTTHNVNWIIGTYAQISYDFSDVLSDVKIELSRNGGVDWEIISLSAPNVGVFSWLVNGTASNSCLVRISGLQYTNPIDGSIIDFSDISSTSFNSFSIIRV
jgi:hypothetical protein